MSKRSETAKNLFLEGYNCSQSVAAAYADAFGIDQETMFRIAASFGAGIGRMRKTCGADQEGKRQNYATVRAMADAFRKKNQSITCMTLLGLRKAEKSAQPSERTPEYYRSRPCLKMILDACEIVEEFFPDLAE